MGGWVGACVRLLCGYLSGFVVFVSLFFMCACACVLECVHVRMYASANGCMRAPVTVHIWMCAFAGACGCICARTCAHRVPRRPEDVAEAVGDVEQRLERLHVFRRQRRLATALPLRCRRGWRHRGNDGGVCANIVREGDLAEGREVRITRGKLLQPAAGRCEELVRFQDALSKGCGVGGARDGDLL